jgi:hypothetical protein
MLLELIMPKPLIKQEIRELKPKDAHTKYLGNEPVFAGPPQTTEEYQNVLGRALNWYNYFYSNKEAKELLAEYLEHNNRIRDAKYVRKVPDSLIVSTYGWVARCSLRGLPLTEVHTTNLENEIIRLIGLINKDDPEVDELVTNRPNVQEIMRERTAEAGGELEGYFDEFLAAGAKKDFTIKVMDEFSKRNILPQHTSLIINPWTTRKAEFEELLKGKDVQLKEAYAKFNKTQIKNIISYIDKVLNDLNSYISVKKASKAPRKRKAVPVEKIVSKLKHLKAFTDPALKLDLVGLSPVKLHNCEEAWVYDTKRRKLHHYIADSYSKVLLVKGNTLIGFDKQQSEMKTLRKPAEQIKGVTGSKPAARKFFKDIKAVAASPNGRFNPCMIILKAF